MANVTTQVLAAGQTYRTRVARLDGMLSRGQITADQHRKQKAKAGAYYRTTLRRLQGGQQRLSEKTGTRSPSKYKPNKNKKGLWLPP